MDSKCPLDVDLVEMIEHLSKCERCRVKASHIMKSYRSTLYALLTESER